MLLSIIVKKLLSSSFSRTLNLFFCSSPTLTVIGVLTDAPLKVVADEN